MHFVAHLEFILYNYTKLFLKVQYIAYIIDNIEIIYSFSYKGAFYCIYNKFSIKQIKAVIIEKNIRYHQPDRNIKNGSQTAEDQKTGT